MSGLVVREDGAAETADWVAKRLAREVMAVRRRCGEYRTALLRMGAGADLMRASQCIERAAEALVAVVEAEGMF